MRGNPGLCDRQRTRLGSIPACAGEPWSGTAYAPATEVYPRVCGGTGLVVVPGLLGVGLSPRVRGNPICPPLEPGDAGSIPACAGEPAARWAARTSGRVYPRVCGGTSTSHLSASFCQGLSPRVRGNLMKKANNPKRSGSIPACAGEPPSSGGLPHRAGVYPRVCGGTVVGGDGVGVGEGLSPRVRGNRTPLWLRPGQLRSIPACAGEPPKPKRGAEMAEVYPRVCGGTGPTRSEAPVQ